MLTHAGLNINGRWNPEGRQMKLYMEFLSGRAVDLEMQCCETIRFITTRSAIEPVRLDLCYSMLDHERLSLDCDSTSRATEGDQVCHARFRN